MIMNEKELTGYPSIDKPWLKYYSEEAINTPLPECTIYEYLLENNKDHLDDIAIIYFNRKIKYKQLFDAIDRAASVFSSFGVAKGDIVMICTLNTPEMIYCAYALNKIGAIADFEYPTLSEDELYSTIKALNAKAVVMLDLFRKKYKDITNHTQNCLFISPCSSFSFTMKAVYKLKGKNVIDTLTPLIKNAKADNIAQEHKHDQPAIIVHTGGSTGVPKGVMLNDDMKILNRDNDIHTFIDEPIPLYEMPEKEALIYLREVMATRQWEMMERYGVSTRKDELQGFGSSGEKWHAHLRERMKGVSRYDSSIEKCSDYRSKDIIRPEDTFKSIADIIYLNEYNINDVLYAREILKNCLENDFQRLY